MTQAQALDILKMGKNVFVTGPAGSGKTFVVNEYIKYLRSHNVGIGITASTGIAATHMGGVTIHSWAGIGIRTGMHDHDIDALTEKQYLKRRFSEASVLIIDEVSMLHHYRLDLVDRVCRKMKKNDTPFGGMQVILCGDFFQLPPISRPGEPESYFIYRADSWRDAGFTICYLSEQHRQKNDVSLTILNEIRAGEISDDSRSHLESRYNADVRIVAANGSGSVIEPTRLFTHNIDVDNINGTELSKINDTEFEYEMKTRGKAGIVEVLKKSCLAHEILRLRKGARVMCVKNNFEEGYVNGTLGVVVSCGPGVDPVIVTASGKRITIKQASWKIEEEGKVLAELTQYPLRLAWAITVHKSQGMSLDAVEVDLSKSFEPGMGYVALSRVRTLAGLRLLGLNDMALRVHDEVLEFDHELQALSEKAEVELEEVAEKSADNLNYMHAVFLANVAPGYSLVDGKIQKDKNGSKNGKGPVKKVSSLEITADLIRKGKSLNEIATERKLVVETIIDHIERLIELGTVGSIDTEKEDEVGLDMSDILYLKKEISPTHFKKIEKALEEVVDGQTGDAEGRPPLLSPVKSKVGASVSFRDIRLARVLLGYIRRK